MASDDEDTGTQVINHAVQALRNAREAENALLAAAATRQTAKARFDIAELVLDRAEDVVGNCVVTLENHISDVQERLSQVKAALSAPSTPQTPRRRTKASSQTPTTQSRTPTASQSKQPKQRHASGVDDPFSTPGNSQQHRSEAPTSPHQQRQHSQNSGERSAVTPSASAPRAAPVSPAIPTTPGPHRSQNSDERSAVTPSSASAPRAAPVAPAIPPAAPLVTLWLPPPSSTIRYIRSTDTIEVLQEVPRFSEADMEALSITEDMFLEPEYRPDHKPSRYSDSLNTGEILTGAIAICPPPRGQHIYRSFVDGLLGKNCYVECLEFGIFSLLKMDIGPNVFFIVVQGVRPGIYTRTKQLVSDGLVWRGGVVVRLLGTAADAHRVFQKFNAAGKVGYWRRTIA
ncbi:hypothetical protein VNI00_017539 [Paramarasmius palmivorus]|uniref:Uncharacterized protein n=1 Tax=Paramarasmius palmivorus TaxID=297713 RepID=A0AAW0B5Z0_9AGAR